MMLIVYARSSTIWQPLAVLVAAALPYGVARWFARRCRNEATLRAPRHCTAARLSSPLSPCFRCTSRTQCAIYAQRGKTAPWRLVWHMVFQAAHNNPDREKVFGSPMSISPLGDGVPMYFFERELKTRSIGHNDVAIKSAEMRKYHRHVVAGSFYENMLRDVFFRQLRQHPLYFIKTFLIHQPVALIRTIGEVLVRLRSIILAHHSCACAGCCLGDGTARPRSPIASNIASAHCNGLLASTDRDQFPHADPDL